MFYETTLGLRRTWVSPPIARLQDASGMEIQLHERPTSGNDGAVALSFAVDDVGAATFTPLRQAPR